MDLVKKNQKKRLNKIKEKKQKHGWYINGYVNNKIYSKYDTNEYVEVSFITEEKSDIYIKQNIKYVGLVNEYLGNMPQKSIIINKILNKYYDNDHSIEYSNKYII